MSSFFKKAFQVVLVAGLIGYVVQLAPQAQLDFLRWKTENSVVRVLSVDNTGGGTGFAMKAKSGKNFIVTNKHVCEIEVDGWVFIKPTNKSGVYRKVVYVDNKHDLCLIEGDSRLNNLELAGSPRINQINYVIGHPALRDLSIAQGEFIGYKTIEMPEDVSTRAECKWKVLELPEIYRFIMGRDFLCLKPFKSLSLTTVSYPGNSGSPVLNRFGRVMGVLFAGSREQERDNYAVPAEELKRVLEQF